MKGPIFGVLLTEVGVDANGQVYPFSYFVVEKECYKSWKLFLQTLMEDLSIINDVARTFISDTSKGLINVVHELISNAEHIHCLRSLYYNFSLKHKGLALKRLMFDTGKVSRESDFQKVMERIKNVDEEAYQWYMSINPCHWQRLTLEVTTSLSPP